MKEYLDRRRLAGIAFIIRRRAYLLLLAALFLAVAWWIAPRLQFDRSIESMFPPASPVLQSYQRLKRTFGGNEIVLAAYRDPQLFAADGQGLARVSRLRQQLAAVGGVKAVLSIDQPLPGELILSGTSLAQRTRALFAGYTHSTDGATVALACLLHPEHETAVPRQATIDGLRRALATLPTAHQPGYLTGEPIMLVDGYRYIEHDGRRLGIWSMVLLGATIVICFRSLRWVLIPLIVVEFSLIVTQAILVLTRLQLSMVSSMLTAVVMVVGVATIVHLMVRFAELRSQSGDVVGALQQTFEQLAPAITWACLTDAAGFLSLTISPVGPVHDFGIMMAIGSLLVGVSVFLIVPGATTWGHVDTAPQSPWGETFVSVRLQRLLGWMQRRPRTILTLVCLTSGLAIGGMGQLRVETDFTRNFRATSDIAMSYQFVEDRLGGAGVCDIIIPAPPELTWEYLARVRQLGQSLGPPADPRVDTRSDELKGITKAFSLADAVAELSPVRLEDKPAAVQNGLVYSTTAAMRGWMPIFFHTLHGVDPENGRPYLRLMLRVQERQSAEEKQRMLARVDRLVHAAFPEADVTGYFVLLSYLIDSVHRDQWRTFVFATVAIGLLMYVAFGDRKLACLALLPNAFPVMIVLGVMGWLSRWVWPGLRINMGTAMIAAVSMGLSIDSSIHYILGFQYLLAAGVPFDEALQQIQGKVGKSLVLSTIALAVGFTVLATSDFIPTVYFGSLVTLAMLGGLAGNLVGLPLLLTLFWRQRTRPAKSTSAP